MRTGSLFVTEFNSQTSADQATRDAGLIREIYAGGNVGNSMYFPNFRPTGIAAVGDGKLIFPGRQWSDPGASVTCTRLNFSRELLKES